MDQERVNKLVRELIIEIGEDPTREGLKDTPERIGRMYQEIFNGYESDSELSYSPNGRVFGISKLIRLVEKYSKRLQIQERLTKNIADELFAQGVKGVVVVTDAEHLCMKMRGVRNDATLTSAAYRGIYENKEEKESIMAMIRKHTSNTSL
jgi:GTP cyclohydrolase I